MSCSNCDCPFYEIQAEEGPLSAAEVSCLVTSCVQKVEFGNDEVLFMQGQTSSNLYSLAVGLVKICAHTSDGRDLLACVQDRGDVAVRLIQAVNAQLAHSRALMEVMGHKSAAAKIASFILLMTPKSAHGNCRFPMPFSRVEMASLLGLSEETVCRLMANMKRDGAIYAPRGHVEIRDWDRLHAIADGKAGSHVGA